MISAPEYGRLMSFATIGAWQLVQDLASRAMAVMPTASPSEVAEETLALISVASAGTLASVFDQAPEVASAITSTTTEWPFLYRDYLIADLKGQGALTDALIQEEGEATARLERTLSFYGAHLPKAMPGPSLLSEKLPLWMGRISPAKLSTTVEARLTEIDATGLVSRHVRVIRAFALGLTEGIS